MKAANFLPQLGVQALDLLRGLGHAAFFVVDLLRNSVSAVSRPFLTIAQIHAIGNRSLVIMLASGLAVGFVPHD